MTAASDVRLLALPLERDLFLRTLVWELAGNLEEIVGYAEAAGYISLVGLNVGTWLDGLYRSALGVPRLSRTQVEEVLVDLKRRIGGSFAVVASEEGRILLESSACPFEEKVVDRPSMCMMTSNVFGAIAAENLGYAKVALEQTLARKDPVCRVVVYLRPSAEADAAPGREYFRKGT
jgi:hypothetical protein